MLSDSYFYSAVYTWTTYPFISSTFQSPRFARQVGRNFSFRFYGILASRANDVVEGSVGLDSAN